MPCNESVNLDTFICHFYFSFLNLARLYLNTTAIIELSQIIKHQVFKLTFSDWKKLAKNNLILRKNELKKLLGIQRNKSMRVSQVTLGLQKQSIHVYKKAFETLCLPCS